MTVMSYSSAIAATGIGLLSYVVIGVLYRLYFSPISKFPGPKLAAITLWYEFYYDVILGGQYTFHIRDLHAKYGSIVRINPYELHISDPHYYDTLYASSASGEKRDKWEWYTKAFAIPQSGFATVGHDQHRGRRAALNRFFSISSVRRLQPLIDERAQQVLERVRRLRSADGEVMLADHVFAAYSNDVIMEYAYGRSDHRLEKADFGHDYYDAAKETAKAASLLKQMIWIFYAIQRLPEWLAARLSPNLDLIIRLHQSIERQIAHVKAQPSSSYHDLAHPTIFHEILQSNLPDSEKSNTRLKEEAIALVGAATTTTSWALCVATYHLLASPRVLAKLKAELRTAIPDPNAGVSLSVLENIPYLVAVVQEAVRLSYGVSSRLQRVSPRPLQFTDPRNGKEWTIPPNTPVGMTSALLHHDESIFMDSRSFIPERWIDKPQLNRYMVSFSKGSRQCLGMNLAYAEIYICLAKIFRRFGSSGENGVRDDDDEGVLQLFETGLRDVEMEADGFVPLAAKGSKGVRIKVNV